MQSNFKSIFSFEDFLSLHIEDMFKSDGKFMNLLCIYINGLASSGELTLNGDFEKHECDEIAIFNVIKNGSMDILGDSEPTHYLLPAYRNRFKSLIAGSFSMRLSGLIDRRDEVEGQKEKLDLYYKFLDWMDRGYSVTNLYKCDVCGESFRINFSDWNLKLETPRFDMTLEEVRKSGIICDPIKPCTGKGDIELDIELKTGNLLISDWFRLEEFNTLLKSNIELSTTASLIEATQFALNKGKVISITVGNSNPQIFKRGNTLIFGRGDEDGYGGCESIGSVITNLWNVTIVEKETLIDILREGGNSNPELTVDEYIRNNDVEEVQVESGNYKVIHNPFTHLSSNSIGCLNLEVSFYMKKV